MRKLIIFLVLELSLIMGVPNAQDTDRQRQIEEFQERLGIKRTQYEELSRKEKDQIEKLRSIEEQVALSNQLILKLKRESERLRKSISGHDKQLASLKVDYGEKKKALYRRMDYIYKHGNGPLWLSLISSGNPTEALVAFKNARSLMEYDRKLVSSLESFSRRIESELGDMRNDMRLLDDLQEDYQDELEIRETSLSVRRELLGKIRGDRSKVAEAITSMEDDAGTVSEIFADLERVDTGRAAGADLPGLSRDKGNLIWPVQGNIVRGFGTTKDKRGIKLTNPGIDIKGLSGSNVLAAATGMVIYVSWLRGYGQFIILNHGIGYYTLYANLVDIYVETGDLVSAGETIAKIGDLGSVEGSTLHFELRLKRESLNPLQWLR